MNACYSKIQAEAISKHIQYVIGISKEIGDIAAITFSTGFYKALAANHSIPKAYEFGCAELLLLGVKKDLIPILHIQNRKQGQEKISADHFFHLREEMPPFVSTLEECEEMWVIGKDCHSLLTDYGKTIQQAAIEGKRIRFLIVDHSNQSLVAAMAASSDTRPEPARRMAIAEEAVDILKRIAENTPPDTFEFKLVNFLPTNTCVIFNGTKSNGRMTVEYYGYKISAGQRLHIHLKKEDDPQTRLLQQSDTKA